MAACKACGQAQARAYPVQEVLTMHIRGLQERRVQALGEQLTVHVCDSCLDSYIAQVLNPRSVIQRSALGFGAMLVLGVALFLLFGAGKTLDLRVPGALMAGLSVVALWQRVRLLQARASHASALYEEERRWHFLPEYLQKVLPVKSGENDLSYIPLKDDLKNMSPSALAVKHKLVAQIAIQLHDRLNGVETPPPPAG